MCKSNSQGQSYQKLEDNPIKNSRLGNIDLQHMKIKMEIYLNFNKPQIREKVIKFLDANIPNEEVKKSMARLIKGTHVKHV